MLDLTTYYKTITHGQTSSCRELLSNPLDASLELVCDDLRSLRFHLDIVRQSSGGLPGTQPSSASPPLLHAPLLRYKRRGAASTDSVRVTSCQTESTTHTCLTFKEHTPASRHRAAATSGIARVEDAN